MGDWTDPERTWQSKTYMTPARPVCTCDAVPGIEHTLNCPRYVAVPVEAPHWCKAVPFVDPAAEEAQIEREKAEELAKGLGNTENRLKTTVLDHQGRDIPFVGLVRFRIRRNGVLELRRNGRIIAKYAAGGWICVLQG